MIGEDAWRVIGGFAVKMAHVGLSPLVIATSLLRSIGIEVATEPLRAAWQSHIDEVWMVAVGTQHGGTQIVGHVHLEQLDAHGPRGRRDGVTVVGKVEVVEGLADVEGMVLLGIAVLVVLELACYLRARLVVDGKADGVGHRGPGDVGGAGQGIALGRVFGCRKRRIDIGTPLPEQFLRAPAKMLPLVMLSEDVGLEGHVDAQLDTRLQLGVLEEGIDGLVGDGISNLGLQCAFNIRTDAQPQILAGLKFVANAEGDADGADDACP